jgi:hypothetical protein
MRAQICPDGLDLDLDVRTRKRHRIFMDSLPTSIFIAVVPKQSFKVSDCELGNWWFWWLMCPFVDISIIWIASWPKRSEKTSRRQKEKTPKEPKGSINQSRSWRRPKLHFKTPWIIYTSMEVLECSIVLALLLAGRRNRLIHKCVFCLYMTSHEKRTLVSSSNVTIFWLTIQGWHSHQTNFHFLFLLRIGQLACLLPSTIIDTSFWNKDSQHCIEEAGLRSSKRYNILFN